MNPVRPPPGGSGRERRWSPVRAAALSLALAAGLCGCSTFAGWSFDGPRIYGGVRWNVASQGQMYRGEVALAAWEWFTWPPLLILDLPLAAVADTLLLPATIPLAASGDR